MMLNILDTQNQKRLMKPLFLVPTKESLDKAAAMTAALEIIESGKVKPCVAEQKRVAFEAESNRLVKRTESPTGFFSNLYQAQKQQKRTFTQERWFNKLKANSIEKREFDAQLHICPEPLSLASRKTISKSSYFADLPKDGVIGKETKTDVHRVSDGAFVRTISKETKTCVRMYHQEWSGNYRLGLETGALGSKSTPPSTTGERFTESLSSKAVINILESGAYLSACRGGYSTFLTLTFNNEARKRILDVVAIPQGKVKNYKWGQVRCVDGVPVDYAQTNNALDIEKAENIKGYCNAIPASGAFSSVEFKPVSSIGAEVSRFFDASQRMYQRGWFPRFKEVTTAKSKAAGMVIYSGTKKKVKSALPMICPEFVDPFASDGETFDDDSIEAVRYNPRKHNSPKFLERMAGQVEKQAPLDYMWVAEMPENEQGEKNPHVHVLMRWRVEQPVFRAWAERLEGIWKHGFAKLEPIDNPAAASNYLLKAVGYLTKGGDSGQGIIRGNRYGISASARAPKWECIGEFYSDNFLAILGELREKLHRRKAIISAKSVALSQNRTKQKGLVKKLVNINKKTFTEKRAAYIDEMKLKLDAGSNAIKEFQEKSHNLPFVNDFAIGNLDENQAVDFIAWAMRERFWNCDIKSNRYNTWDELKASTIDVVKENRRYWKNYADLLQTSELSWLWAANRSNFEVGESAENVMIDQDGREWEQVA